MIMDSTPAKVPQSPQQIKRWLCEPCKTVKKETKARCLCYECHELLCESCSYLHLRFKMAQNHNLIDLVQFLKSSPHASSTSPENEEEISSDFWDDITLTDDTVLYSAQVAIQAAHDFPNSENSTSNPNKVGAGCSKLLVAAIDFGSSYSGYAFQFHHDFRNNPLQISTNQWDSNASGFMSHKTPSVVLLDEDKKFHSFGYDAEDKYANLIIKKEHKDWYYFTGIKMKLMTALDTFKSDMNDKVLFKERLKRDAVIKDMEDREYPLLDLMAMAYKYLIDHFLRQLEQKTLLDGITPASDILWVITVPAIWTDASKQFTKEAAIKAGLSEHQIKLAYEPEAAALYCRLLAVDKSLDKFVSGGEESLVFSTFERGKKFMVLDLGGGTVDIAVQETTSNGQMKNIHKVCGGPWGGQAVDEEFRKCITKIFGGDVLFGFKSNYRDIYLAFLRSFELKKREAKLVSISPTNLAIPVELCDLLEDTTDCTLKETLSNSSFTGKIKSVSDKLVFTPEQFHSFFSGALESIKEHMENIFEDERCQNLTSIILVGGFADSNIVVKYLRDAFPEHKFIVPIQAGLSVVMGAVLYGHDPDVICARTCRYTYGTSVAKPFRDGIDPLQKRFLISGEFYCNHRFAKTFTIRELVNIGDSKSIEIDYDYRDKERQIFRYKPIDILVLISSTEDPTYTDDDGITRLGEIRIPLTNKENSWPEYFHCSVYMEIAGTEIEVTCTLDTGESVKGRFEFLIE